MIRKTKKHQKKLAKLVLAALLLSGGAYGLMCPSVAEAADSLTVTGYSDTGGFVPVSDALILADGYYYAPKDGNVVELNLANGTWSDPGSIAGHVGTDAKGANGITVNVTGANVVVSDIYGGIAVGEGSSKTDVGNASGNIVNISAGSVGDVYGGESYSYYYDSDSEKYYGGNANENKVTISEDAKVGGSVYGGYAGYGNANENKVTISENAKVGGSVYGGYASAYSYIANANASGNTVTINGSAEVGGSVYGGHTYEAYFDTNANASDNTIEISGNAKVGGSVYGGSVYYTYYSENTNASGNTVTISGNASVGANADYAAVYGGSVSYAYYNTDANANGNTVTISGSASVGANASYVEIFGGYTDGDDSTNANANDNSVTISGSAVVGSNVENYVLIYGGESYYGSTNGNTVTISGEAVVGSNAGDYVQIYGGHAYYEGANDNTVTISGGTVGNANSEDVEYGSIIGGSTEAYDSGAEASGNTVTIEGETTKVSVGHVAGGYSYYAYAAVVNTNNNIVTINAAGAEVGLVYGGRTYKGDANENTVTIKAGSVTGKGDHYYYGIAAVAGGYSVTGGDAKSNTVEISGGTVSNSNDDITMAVVGGYAGEGDATGNTVKLQDATITGGGVYGGATDTGGTGDVVTGNTLVISGSSTVDAEVTNFETIKIDKTLEWNPDKPVLKAKQFAKNADADGTRAALDVTDVKTDIAPGKGGQMTLLASDAENDFATLDLIYSGGTATLDESKQSQVVKDEEISDERKGVAVISQSVHTVSLDEENSYKNVLYSVENETKGVSIKEIKWQKDAELFDGSTYDYKNVTKIDTSVFDVTYEDGVPQTVAKGDSMTLLKANETLTAIVNEEKSKAYSFTPVSGVTVDAAVTGKLTNSGNNVVFTATENKAGKLTFGDVEWKTSGALMKRPSNITFAGADVDTSKINFTNMTYLDANQQMTLVSDFGDTVGTITGSKYLVGTAFEGEGAASLSGKELIFRTKTGTGVSEQTHKTVMATEAGVTALTIGNDYIGKALDGMGDVANVAPDGSTVGAAIGGGKNRYETGSHVNVNSWNAAVAVGAKREMKNGSLEYGVFGEYGKANFTLHSDAGRGDGDARYAGGGLVAKWTNKHDVYTEASFRLGRLSENSSDIMRDGLGNTYGYDVHANYYGAHVGVGKIFRYNGGRSLDVYGKYFYTKRNGVEFDAVQHYNLDSVSSSVLRVGARYGTTDKKWNWYGGLAYEYEFDGEAKGVVNGVAIRAASIKGSSVRGEIGMRMNATKTNPWQTDISIYGYGGKHRGFGGNVNVAYMF